MEDLNISAESGSLKGLDISEAISDDSESKKKQLFVDNLCALIRKSRSLINLNISKILVRAEAQQNYIFMAIQLTASKQSLSTIIWNNDFRKATLVAKLCSICLDNFPNLRYLSITPKEAEMADINVTGELADDDDPENNATNLVAVEMFQQYELTQELHEL